MIDLNTLKRIIEPIRNRILNILSRGITQNVDDSGPRQKIKASFFKDEVHDNVERFQNYGLTSNPPPNSTAIALFHSGIRENGIIICVENRQFRLKNLAPGEIALYTDEGDKIHFKRGNEIEITTSTLTVNSTAKVTLNSSEVIVNTESAVITSVSSTINAQEVVTINAPLLDVKGLVSCTGLGAGSPPSPGQVKVTGTVEVSGNIKSNAEVSDSSGSMSTMRTKYNSHKHNQPDPPPIPSM